MEEIKLSPSHTPIVETLDNPDIILTPTNTPVKTLPEDSITDLPSEFKPSKPLYQTFSSLWGGYKNDNTHQSNGESILAFGCFVSIFFFLGLIAMCAGAVNSLNQPFNEKKINFPHNSKFRDRR